MFKLLSSVISITLLSSAVFFVNGEVAAKTSFEGIYGDTIQSPTGNYLETAKSANDVIFEKNIYELRNFIDQVYTGQPNVLTGIFVSKGFAMDVSQQPSNNPGFISTLENTVTDFRLARDYGSIGLLAHNYLAGDQFFVLEEGQVIYLVYGDGEIQKYTIFDIRKYQALQPNSPYSNFVNLENSEDFLSAAELFYSVYDQDDALILQTCIENQGIETWGRLFIIAIPGAIPEGSVM